MPSLLSTNPGHEPRRPRSPHFVIYLMTGWWLLWLGASVTPLNIYVPPSWAILGQFAAFVLFFFAGHAMAVLWDRPDTADGACGVHARQRPFNLRYSLHVVNWACFGVLLLSMNLSGAFTEDFLPYLLKLRSGELDDSSLTGSRQLDIATKVLVFPLAYTVTTIVMAIRIRNCGWILTVAVVNILLFSYLWQVNYSLIHLFWFFVFYVLLGLVRGSPPNRNALVFALLLVCLLVAVAVNRFGGDVAGAVQRYILGYHMAGFSFYGHHVEDPASLLHDHTFGRSSLGFLEQALEIFTRRLGLDFVAANTENGTLTIESVDLGAVEIVPANAFGTFLFGFYRDFNLLGVALGGLLYGMVATHVLNRSRRDWAYAAVFYVLASAWMVGMMVNPLEQAHFWLSVLFIALLSSLNRGWKL